MTAGQAGEVLVPIIEVVLGMSSARAQYWIGKKKKLAAEIRKVLIGSDPYMDLIADWENFYRDLGINCNLSGVAIPDDPGGFERIIFMASGVTPQSGYDLCVRNFKCWKYTENNLNEIVISDRTAKNSPYAIRIRNRIEADEELKNLSAKQLKTQGVDGITLEERFVYEIKYFKETGKHLDITKITLCAGSRYSDGGVPHVYWSGVGMLVDWYNSGDAGDGLRPRQAVS